MEPCISTRLAALGALIAVAVITAPALAGTTAQAPAVSTSRQCYVVGQAVGLKGRGFAPSSSYVLSIDGVYFGDSTTGASGSFSSRLPPGGLGANVAEHVNHVSASDGSSVANTTFTVTRAVGARFLASAGNPQTLRAPFEVWDFSPSGLRRPVYVHYVSPKKSVVNTVSLGSTGGQCGYLRTGRHRVFPFTPAAGTWTLQIDTSKAYAPRPGGPVARITVGIV